MEDEGTFEESQLLKFPTLLVQKKWATLDRYLGVYNHLIQRNVEGHLTPIQTDKPELFKKQFYNHVVTNN